MRKTAYDVAVIGATGTVGREIVAVMVERGFPLGRLRLFATRASLGQQIEGTDAGIEELDSEADLSGNDLVFLACPPEVAQPWGKRAVAAGAWVIDTSVAPGEAETGSLVVPEVNAPALAKAKESRWVASPHPIAVGLAVVLHALRQLAPLTRVVATALEPASLLGRAGVEVLEEEVRTLLRAAEPEPSDLFPQRVAFNVCPIAGGLTCSAPGLAAENQAVRHLRSVLDAPDLPIQLNRVLVPVFFGLAITVDVVLQASVGSVALAEHLRSAPGLLLVESSQRATEPALLVPTPATVVGSDATHVACLSLDPRVPAVDLWVALDNTRKGSATNAVQIAELLVRDHL